MTELTTSKGYCAGSISVKLRDEQNDFVDGIRHSVFAHKITLAVASPAFGKTYCAGFIAASAIEKKRTVMFCVHKRQLLIQTANSFKNLGIKYGFIAAKFPKNPYASMQIAMIGTLNNKYLDLPVPDIFIADEAHLSMSPTWQKIIRHYLDNGCYVIGLTGTPIRLSGQGMGELYNDMVLSKSPEWLIENKRLSDYKLYAPVKPDMSKAKMSRGDYTIDSVLDVMDNGSVLGNAVKYWKKFAQGKRTAIYCVDVAHAQNTAMMFNAHGIPAAYITGDSTDAEIRKAIMDFADNKILVLCSCNMISEGFDLSATVGRDVTIEAAISLRPTQSLALYLQQIFRALRYKPFPAILIDMAGNTARHGLPDHDHQWTLEGQKKKKRRKKDDEEEDIKINTCPKCFICHEPAPVCPDCGHIYEIKERTLDEVDGDVEEIDKDEIKRQLAKIRNTEESKCQTEEDFKELGKQRNYKPGWARKRWQLRMQRKSN